MRKECSLCCIVHEIVILSTGEQVADKTCQLEYSSKTNNRTNLDEGIFKHVHSSHIKILRKLKCHKKFDKQNRKTQKMNQSKESIVLGK